jgi:flagellar motor switch protein FliM
MTSNYESVLKKQIELLTENKGFSEQKESQDQIFNENVEKLTQEYEVQIKQFETKVKNNVKKIQDLSGGNIINRLLKNQRFRQAMLARGCSLDSL